VKSWYKAVVELVALTIDAVLWFKNELVSNGIILEIFSETLYHPLESCTHSMGCWEFAKIHVRPHGRHNVQRMLRGVTGFGTGVALSWPIR